nr:MULTISPECIES: class I SAM-dependent methyltransferase [unclassified Streptomyces]
MEYWNHNVQYHPLVLDAVPEVCREALDIGCGEGLLARRLAQRVGAVTGVDSSPAMIRLARERGAHLGNATFTEGDFLTKGLLPEDRYDFISAVAVVHHVDFTAAIGTMARLLSPGGRLLIIGLARDRTLLDWTVSAAGVPAARLHAHRHGGKTDPPGMPVKDAAMPWSDIRRKAAHLLPGSHFRRHLLWRYSLTWNKPRRPDNRSASTPSPAPRFSGPSSPRPCSARPASMPPRPVSSTRTSPPTRTATARTRRSSSAKSWRRWERSFRRTPRSSTPRPPSWPASARP